MPYYPAESLTPCVTTSPFNRPFADLKISVKIIYTVWETVIHDEDGLTHTPGQYHITFQDASVKRLSRNNIRDIYKALCPGKVAYWRLYEEKITFVLNEGVNPVLGGFLYDEPVSTLDFYLVSDPETYLLEEAFDPELPGRSAPFNWWSVVDNHLEVFDFLGTKYFHINYVEPDYSDDSSDTDDSSITFSDSANSDSESIDAANALVQLAASSN